MSKASKAADHFFLFLNTFVVLLCIFAGYRSFVHGNYPGVGADIVLGALNTMFAVRSYKAIKNGQI